MWRTSTDLQLCWANRNADSTIMAPIQCELANQIGTLFQITLAPIPSCIHNAQTRKTSDPLAITGKCATLSSHRQLPVTQKVRIVARVLWFTQQISLFSVKFFQKGQSFALRKWLELQNNLSPTNGKVLHEIPALVPAVKNPVTNTRGSKTL